MSAGCAPRAVASAACASDGRLFSRERCAAITWRKAAWAQAQAIMGSPGLAQAFLSVGSGGGGAGGPAESAKSAEVYAALKDDPELAHVFDDVKNNGPGALQK